MFKEKSSKKKITTDINETVTLDAMHNNMIKDFERSDKEKIYYTKKLNSADKFSSFQNNFLIFAINLIFPLLTLI